MTTSDSSQKRAGIGYALMAYGSWGVFPLYWKLLKEVPQFQLLAHRVLWSSVFLVVLLYWKERKLVRTYFSKARSYMGFLVASASIITLNWFTYLYAVNSDRVLEASLGYFISPLVSVFLGMLFLKERLRTIQKFSFLLASLGVLQLSMRVEGVPVLSLLLAFSFGIYALIRKKVPLDPLVASTIESTIQVVPVLAIFILSGIFGFQINPGLVWKSDGISHFQSALLILGGVVTALPLLWFAYAAKRLPMSTLGFFQYLSPSVQFLLAVYLFSEPFSAIHARGFFCIWIALAFYTIDLWRSSSGFRKYEKRAEAARVRA